MLLTLTEIMTISECYPDREHFARAVIAAYEAKLREQEPVLWRYKHADEQIWTIAEPRNFYANTVEDTVNDIKHYISKGYAYILQPLFEHPASIPEGWQLVPIEPTTEMIIAGNDGFHSPDMRRHTVSGCYKAMLAVVRSGE